MSGAAKYLIIGFRTTDIQADCDGAWFADTLAEAKRTARHVVTDKWARDAEADEPCAVSQVWKDGAVVADFFR